MSPPVVLAPMAGVTNAPFRRSLPALRRWPLRERDGMARAYLEGSAPPAWWPSPPTSGRGASSRHGVDPADVGEAVARLTGVDGVDHIDLNPGCPAAKVTRKGGGAPSPPAPRCWRHRARRVRAAAPAGVPVTVKFRLGIDDSLPTSLTTGRIAEDEGAAAVAPTPGPPSSTTRARRTGPRSPPQGARPVDPGPRERRRVRGRRRPADGGRDGMRRDRRGAGLPGPAVAVPGPVAGVRR